MREGKIPEESEVLRT